MSVKVEALTKIYGEQRAVDNISFEVKPGEVVGFLGPNGAGKSTTMKIVTSFIPQTSGKVWVDDYDVNASSMEVRERIGYLPEHNPLYTDMYVKEYLGFITDLHKIKNKKKRIEEMVDITGLAVEQKKKIGQLSKGYRQRVGLAQAMIHDPKVLILDEPTSGLDPNQLAEIRGLIKELGKEKTVILSTHIMQEVQAICDRVIIISKGKIVADDTVQQLQEQIQSDTSVIVEFSGDVDQDKLKQISGVTKVKSVGDNKWQLFSSKKDIRPDIFAFAARENLTLLEIQKEKITLEQVFQRLTKS